MNSTGKQDVADASDTITTLKSCGPFMTKVFDGDNVRAYDRAKLFTVQSHRVSSIAELSKILRTIEVDPQYCVIRGQFIGAAAAEEICPCEKPGLFRRLNHLFVEAPHHWVMFDVDNYNCSTFNPATEPAEAVQEFINDALPQEFCGVSYHWQLSASAGRVPGQLKCHIWFWIKREYTGPQLQAWIRSLDLAIDITPMRRVQVHYTANPVFRNGAIDPVIKRSGLFFGRADSVHLVIDEALLVGVAVAEEHKGRELKLADPRLKAGAIGAFCRSYSISRVLKEVLPEQFEFVTDRRVTWLLGGGSVEGCFVTADDQYMGNMHDSSPHTRLVNAWDLARIYKFGNADDNLESRDLYAVNQLPSHQAMCEWAESLPEVPHQLTAVTAKSRRELIDSMLNAESEQQLREVVLPEIRACQTLEKVDREHIAKLLQRKWLELMGTSMQIADARNLVTQPRIETCSANAPEWMKDWVFCIANDRFFNLDTRASTSITGFDMMHDRNMRPYMADDGFTAPPHASNFCRSYWNIATVVGISYWPGAGRVFEFEGQQWANSYSDRGIPAIPAALSDAEVAAVAVVQGHLERLFPGERERAIFISWLAYVATVRGAKVRWSPFIYGGEGVGKSFLMNLLAKVMGSSNVAPLDAGVLCESSFTGWALGYAVRCIEEVKLHGHNAYDVTNKLKQFHTNDIIDVHQKGKDSFTAPNKTNYLLLSNYFDGIPITKGDRRYLILHCALEAAEAKRLAESGYFESLFGAIEGFPGAVLKWLSEYQLHPEFKPDGQAPMTDAKSATIELGKTDIQMAAEEMIEQGGQTGICSLAISSSCLTDALYSATGKDIFTKSVHTLLTNIGFVYFGDVKWRKKKHRIWVPSGGSIKTNEGIRLALDAAEEVEGGLS